ncbi:MAG: aminoacyl-tRNA hydrolase, partial [Candidatus Saccharibacteria bacterium]
AKPQLFMNQSGKAVAQILKYYPAARVIVVHDELDLPLGSLKIVKNSGAAGHNGVQSVIDEIGTKDFIRVRLGIANPETQGNLPAEDFVLKDFSQQEEALVKETIDKAAGALETIQTEGLELAQSKFNAS